MGERACDWQAVPAREKNLMLEKMRDKCKDLFLSKDVSEETIKTGMRQRVHEVRRAWIDGQKAKQGVFGVAASLRSP